MKYVFAAIIALFLMSSVEAKPRGYGYHKPHNYGHYMKPHQRRWHMQRWHQRYYGPRWYFLWMW